MKPLIVVAVLCAFAGVCLGDGESPTDGNLEDDLTSILRALKDDLAERDLTDEDQDDIVRSLGEDQVDEGENQVDEGVDNNENIESEKRQVISQSSFDATLNFRCHYRKYLRNIVSYHHNHYEDRRWTLHCADTNIPGKHHCFRSQYINDWDGVMSYQCPLHGYIAGVYSVHNNHYEDRRWKVDCCVVVNRCMSDCVTSQQNDWDAHLSYTAPAGRITRGMFSYHHNHYEDRRYRFQACRFRTCSWW